MKWTIVTKIYITHQVITSNQRLDSANILHFRMRKNCLVVMLNTLSSNLFIFITRITMFDLTLCIERT